MILDKEKRKQYNVAYQRKRRLDPSYREAQKLYLKNRRKDPEFIARNKIYLQNFRKKKGQKEEQQKHKNTQSLKGTDRVYDSILVSKKHKNSLEFLLDNLFNSVLILE